MMRGRMYLWIQQPKKLRGRINQPTDGAKIMRGRIKPHLQLITYGNKKNNFTREECQEQLNDQDCYLQADNAMKWLFVKFLIKDRLTVLGAKRKAFKILREGSDTPIDVQIPDHCWGR